MIFEKVLQYCMDGFRERFPWFGSRSFYVADYRCQFETVAKELSAMRKEPVRARFSRTDRCVELYTGTKILAQVRGWGGVYFKPDSLTVRCRLSDAERNLFAEKIPIRLEFSGG